MPLLHLSRREPAGTGLFLLTFDATLPTYDKPGQFVTVHLPGLKPGYFALASTPGAAIQLLVKDQGPTAEALNALPLGSPVEVSEPIGKGFALDVADTRPLVILATGSGISAVRPLIEAELARGLRRPVELFYGVFTPDHLSFEDRLVAWEAAGIGVRVVVSEVVPEWEGMTGFVQAAAERAGWVRSDVTVVLCGYPDMVNEAKRLWEAAGAAPEQVKVNF